MQLTRSAVPTRAAFRSSARPVATPARVQRFAAPVNRRQLAVSVRAAAAATSFYDFEVKDIDGKSVRLDKFKGNVLLVVNLASACGFTPQYAELQSLYTKYKAKGFQVLGFPCNQFGAQEPGSNNEIKRFASSNYGVTFPLMSKVDVNGAGADPVFKFLKEKKGGLLGNDIKWNFSKFLVDKEGNVVGRYPSTTSPGDISRDIEKYL